MIESILIVAFLATLAAILLVLRRARLPEEEDADMVTPQEKSTRSALLWGAVAGLAVGLVVGQVVGAELAIAVAAAFLAFISVRVLVSLAIARRLTRTELRLADAIDLLVSSLRAGASLLEALDSAAASARRPIREMFNELSERVRIGERPDRVLSEIERRFGLESVRVFTFTLTAHWEGGGSLAGSLSNVGRSIRDRVDVTRRVQSQSVETQVSVVGILVITYGLGLMMWSNEPERVETFAQSQIGSMFIALSIVLQAIGLVWTTIMTRVEV
ncbi:MAG: type II secretion system F family protein [Planctomycetota bacterium]